LLRLASLGSAKRTILWFRGGALRLSQGRPVSQTGRVGEAGIRISGNLNLAALYVLNANNFQVSGQVNGLPMKENATQKAAGDAVKDVTQSRRSEQPSIIIVEVLGFGDA
jgi:hypothetical protein